MEVDDSRGGGVHALLHQKELELQSLRETSLRELEDKVAQREAECQGMQERLQTLQEDFNYNLDLLEKRDSELEVLDQQIDVLAAALKEKDVFLADLHQALELAQQELGRERTYFQGTLAAQGKEVVTLQNALADAKRDMAAVVESHTQCEARQQVLQEGLASARAEHAQQTSAQQMQFEERLNLLRAQHEEELEKLRRDVTALSEREEELKKLRGDVTALSEREEEVERLRGDVTALSQLVEKTNRALDEERRGHSSQRLQALEYERELEVLRRDLSAREADVELTRKMTDDMSLKAQKQREEERASLQAAHDAQAKLYLETIENLHSQLRVLQAAPAKDSSDMSGTVRELQQELLALQGQLRDVVASKEKKELCLQAEHEWAEKKLQAMEEQFESEMRTRDAEIRAAVEELWAKEQDLRHLSALLQRAQEVQRASDAAQMAAEHKIEQLEGCVQTHRREVAGLETERHRLLRDVRKLRRSCKVRKVGRRPKPNCGINPAETEFRHLSCVNVRRNSLGSAPIGQNDVGPESGRVGRSDAADAGADARTGARRASSRRGRHPCVEVEEGGGEGGGSGASSPLVSVSVLSEPSSDSPSKWLLSDRQFNGNNYHAAADGVRPQDAGPLAGRHASQVYMDKETKSCSVEAPRELRRPILVDQCVQTTTAGETPGTHPPARPESRGTPTWVDSSHPPAGQATSPQQASAETIRRLAEQLAVSQCRATCLAEENARLMEVSCKLRAAWEHAVVAVLQNNRATCGTWFGHCTAAQGLRWRDGGGQLETVLRGRGPSGACRVRTCAPEVQLALPAGVELAHAGFTRFEEGCDAGGDAAGQLPRHEGTSQPAEEAGLGGLLQPLTLPRSPARDKAGESSPPEPLTGPTDENANPARRQRHQTHGRARKPAASAQAAKDQPRLSQVTGQRLRIRNWNVREP